MNRQMFGFLSLLGVGIGLWTIVQGIGTFFTAFASSWTPEATNTVAASIASLIWLGGVVFVLVCGYAMFATFNRLSRSNGRNGGSQPDEYIVVNDPRLSGRNGGSQPQNEYNDSRFDNLPQQITEAQPPVNSWYDLQVFQGEKAPHR